MRQRSTHRGIWLMHSPTSPVSSQLPTPHSTPRALALPSLPTFTPKPGCSPPRVAIRSHWWERSAFCHCPPLPWGPECKPRQGRVIHRSGGNPPYSILASASTGDSAGTPPPPPIQILSTCQHRSCNLLGAAQRLWLGAVGPQEEETDVPNPSQYPTVSFCTESCKLYSPASSANKILPALPHAILSSLLSFSYKTSHQRALPQPCFSHFLSYDHSFSLLGHSATADIISFARLTESLKRAHCVPSPVLSAEGEQAGKTHTCPPEKDVLVSSTDC